MPVEMLWARLIHIQFLILGCIKLSLQVTKLELITNVIAESMYAQCNADRNEYLLLDLLVDYKKDDKAIFLTEQQI